ncbi:bifunctional oligoribonuclease/PAP phosphatase NrnA [Bacillus timonensis]|uniref:Bifunctional oligoribonuclease/PAP phosphatase NrnA n=1 Tax=Bacillus timonensis TaxID=1033734 RepID=A0A4S3PXX1_9BACI|nr:bifunctional oligoribonuclease/PAP phosphatase NrnA [Bacillus timonensis]THE14749.1 bifunctional oligoribonuclease/PAP phosphatase NrnA [Bacillus timonensis]
MIQEILRTITEFETIIIHRHVRPDPDAYGSQCGLAEILTTSYPTKNIFVVGEDEPSLLFLKEMDKISDETYKEALVIVCDTANQDRISDQRYNQGKKLIKIDHHPNEDLYGDLLWVDTKASSCSEMIYELYLQGKNQGFTLSQEAAKLLFAGMVGDTGRFLFPNTNPKTFTYAGELLKSGFDFPLVYENLYKIKENVARLSGYVYQNYKATDDGVGWMTIPNDVLKKYNVTPAEASQLVSNLGNIENLKTWVFFVEEKDQIRVRLRSKGPIINEVAKKYNGGGHPLASGATIYSWEEVEQVIADLQEVCRRKK